jgi:hypothetical protein
LDKKVEGDEIMGRITKTGRMVLSPATMRSLKAKVSAIDRRLAGKQGMTASGKVIRNPRAYVYSGVRRQMQKR